MKNTTNLNLKKPDYTDPVDIADINENMDTIDAELNKKVNTTDARLSDTRTPKAHNQAISTITGLDTALGKKLETSLKGANNGLAELDAQGKVPATQLPSYVDDVLEYANKAAFPISAQAETGKIYVALDTNIVYRWSGSAYVEISSSLALGTTSSTAYRGDLGNTAYLHSQLKTGNPHSVTAANIGLGNVLNVEQASKAEFDLFKQQSVTSVNEKTGTVMLNGEDIVLGGTGSNADRTIEYAVTQGNNRIGFPANLTTTFKNNAVGAINELNETKQEKLIAGENIAIGEDNVISSDGVSDKNSMKRSLLHYGYPAAINGVWNAAKAADIYAKYDIVVLGGGYELPSHEAHLDTVAIISKTKELNPKCEIFGYTHIGMLAGALTIAQIKTSIDNWKIAGATGIILDEYGYDYKVTRERQNEIVDYCHEQGLNVMANSWEMTYAFAKNNIYLDWINFNGNINNLDTSLNENDYIMFENMFYYVDAGVQKATESGRIYKAYVYNHEAQSEYGMSYKDKFGTKTFFLDGLLAESQDYYNIGYIGSLALNANAYSGSLPNWGASDSNVTHYSAPKVDKFKTAGIPIVEAFSGVWTTSFTNYLGNDKLRLIWSPGTPATDPLKGIREVYVNNVPLRKIGAGIERPKVPYKGLEYYDTTIGGFFIYNGSAWEAQRTTATTVSNTLTSTSATDALSANMGKKLQDEKMPKNGGMLENYTEKLVSILGAGPTATVDLALGNIFHRIASMDTTFSFSNAISGVAHSFTLLVTIPGLMPRALIFPPTVKWQRGEAPSIDEGQKIYLLTFMTIDGGATWLGMFGGAF